MLSLGYERSSIFSSPGFYSRHFCLWKVCALFSVLCFVPVDRLKALGSKLTALALTVRTGLLLDEDYRRPQRTPLPRTRTLPLARALTTT